MPLLGLMTAEQVSTYRPKNVRRSVFLMYPNGTAPLIGLLSMMKDEVVNDPEFKWWEKRFVEQRTTMAYASSTVSFYTVDASFAYTALSTNNAFAADSQFGVKVASGGTAQFRVGQIIRFNILNTSAALEEVHGILTHVDASNDRMAFKVTKAPAVSVDYDAATTGFEIMAIGSAQAEGGASVDSSAALRTLEVYNAPIGITNYTQIFTSNWKITGTAGKTAVWFDTRGVDKDQAKEAAMNNSRYLELAAIFGTKKETVVSSTDVTRTSGGVLYFLQLWEAGATYGNTAATADTDDGKRIIENSSGTISRKTYNKYLERVFRFNRNKQAELLCLCGNGFLNTLAEMYGSGVTFNVETPSAGNYGMKLTSHTTPFGTVFYKTHPLFNQNSTLMYNGLFLDVGCLKYRPMDGRDTALRKNLQHPGADYVEDGWLTEAGFELNSPESFLYLKNVTDYTP